MTMVNTVFADVNITHSNTKVYKNIDGDFSASDTYYYSTEDKKKSKHTAVFSLDSDKINIDGSFVNIDDIDEAPYISGGRTMFPLRLISEVIKVFENEVSVSWNSVDKNAVVTYKDKDIIFTAEKDTYTINGEIRKMSGGTPEIKNNRIFIPIREISDTMNLDMSWNALNKEITISNKILD